MKDKRNRQGEKDSYRNVKSVELEKRQLQDNTLAVAQPGTQLPLSNVTYLQDANLFEKKIVVDTSVFINSVPQCEPVFNPISATPSKKVEGFNPTRDGPQEIPKDISVNLINIGVNKLNKYKFPVRDVIDPKSWSKPFTKEQCIEHITITMVKILKLR